jgi:hypothetical protein
MSNPENDFEQFVPHVLDSEWLAMSAEEQLLADEERYFRTGWNETLFDVKQQVAKEMNRKNDRDIRNIALRGMATWRRKSMEQ